MTSRGHKTMLPCQHGVASVAISCAIRNTTETEVRVPDIYIDGTWLAARGSGSREIRCPADGQLVATSTRPAPRTPQRAIAAARRAFHEGAWPRTSARERGDLLLRVADLLERDSRRRRPGGVPRHRQAPGRERVRRRRRGLGLPPLRPRRRRGRRPGRRHRQPRRGQPDRARAGRGLRADHAVELPAAPGLLEGRALPGGRQHVRAQAERAHAAHRAST